MQRHPSKYFFLGNEGRSHRSKAFSMIEVVLAIGIFLVTVLALVGLLGPTLRSVGDVEKSDEVASVVNTLNAFLQNSPDINPGGSRFNAIFEAVAADNHATVFIFREFTTAAGTDINLRVGFRSDESSGDVTIGDDAKVRATDFSQAIGPIYRAVLSASSVTPEAHRSPERNEAEGVYTLTKTLSGGDGTEAYPEGYLAMEVRIFAEDPPGPAGTFQEALPLSDLKNREPLFTYNTAVVR